MIEQEKTVLHAGPAWKPRPIALQRLIDLRIGSVVYARRGTVYDTESPLLVTGFCCGLHVQTKGRTWYCDEIRCAATLVDGTHPEPFCHNCAWSSNV